MNDVPTRAGRGTLIAALRACSGVGDRGGSPSEHCEQPRWSSGVSLAGHLSEMLAEVPHALELKDADAAAVGLDGPAQKLWDALTGIKGIKWVTASKLLARKRPHLLPVYDEVVREVVGRPGNIWESLRIELQANKGSLATRLKLIGAEGGAGHMSVLRVFDVVAWMTGQQGPT
jgi:hypothetical protein